jgi:predicted ATPase
VGRERELAELRAGLGDALSGHGRLFLISGEPGIGKTRLAEQLSSQAYEQGVRVLWGRCWEGEGAPAYWPIVQILRGCAERPDFPQSVETLDDGITAMTHRLWNLSSSGDSHLTTQPPHFDQALTVECAARV